MIVLGRASALDVNQYGVAAVNTGRKEVATELGEPRNPLHRVQKIRSDAGNSSVIPGHVKKLQAWSDQIGTAYLECTGSRSGLPLIATSHPRNSQEKIKQ